MTMGRSTNKKKKNMSKNSVRDLKLSEGPYREFQSDILLKIMEKT